MKIFLWIIAIVLLSTLVLGWMFWRTDTAVRPIARPPTATPPIQASENVPEGWKQLSYPELGYLLSMPPGFGEEDNGEFSKLFIREAAPSGTGPRNFVYASIVPRGKEEEEGTIYNYSPSDFRTLIAMQPGDKKALGGSAEQNLEEYFTYEKLESRMLGGYGADVFVNRKPWEFPPGTEEYRTIVRFGHVQYIFGGYVTGDADTQDGITRELLDSVLDTIRLTPDSVKPSNPAVTSTTRKSFSNEDANLRFSYPATWTVRTDTQNFREGDLLSLSVTGATQRTQTELHDGASFSVMKPVISTADAETWVKGRYSDEPENAIPTEFSEETFGDRVYQKAYVCGLGCFSYYHTKVNGKIYGFVFLAEGPDKETYESEFRRIMESVSYSG